MARGSFYLLLLVMNKKEIPMPQFGGPALEALALHEIKTLNDLTGKTEKELLKIHGVGPKAIRILKEALTENGMAFKEETK